MVSKYMGYYALFYIYSQECLGIILGDMYKHNFYSLFDFGSFTQVRDSDTSTQLLSVRPYISPFSIVEYLGGLNSTFGSQMSNRE